MRCVFRVFFVATLAAIPNLVADEGKKPADKSRYETRKEHDPDGIGKFYLGREIAWVMGHQAAGWLDRPEREQEEQPAKLHEVLRVKPGSAVADIGAGSGYHTFRLSESVGKAGKVHAVDVQPEMLALLRQRVKARGINNVELVKGTEKDPNLPANALDLILLVDVYHEFSFPFEMTEAMVKALKPGGRLVFVEYRLEDPTVPIKLVHKMSERQVRKEMAEHPVRWTETIAVLPWQHVIVFEKKSAGTPADNQGQAELVNRLRADLASLSFELRLAALARLADLGSGAEPALAEVAKAARDGDPRVSYAASRVLFRIGKPAVPKLVDLLKENPGHYHTYALDALSRMGADAEPAVPVIAARLANPQLAQYTVRPLGRMGPHALAALPDLLVMLNKPGDSNFPNLACHVLERLGPAAAPAVPTLLRRLREERPYRQDSSRVLGSVGKAAVPGLVELLKNQDGQVREYAARALGRIGLDAVPAVPRLIQALENERNDAAAKQMALALGGIGPEAEAAVAVLISVWKKGLGESGEAAAFALGEIGPGAVPALIAEVRSERPRIHTYAVQALGWVGPEAAPAVPVLLEILSKQQYRGTPGVVWALGRTKAQAKSVVPALANALKAQGDTAREAATALKAYGAEAAPALTALLEVLNRSGDYQTRTLVCEVLGQLGPDALGARDILLLALRTKKEPPGPGDCQVRLAMARALARVSPSDLGTARQTMWTLAEKHRSFPDVQAHAQAALIELALRELPPLAVLPLAGNSADKLGPVAAGFFALDNLRRGLEPALAPLRHALDVGTNADLAAIVCHFAADAEKQVPRLLALVESDPEHTRIAVRQRLVLAITLAQMSPREAPAAAHFLGEVALGFMEERAEPHVNRRNRLAATVALGELGDKAKSAVSVLQRAARGPCREIRHAAAAALKQIDPAAAETGRVP